jgi:hypothetical protein
MLIEQENEMTISGRFPGGDRVVAPGRHELQTSQADKPELLDQT